MSLVRHEQSLALLVPAYNAAKHLPRLMQSAVKQTQAFDEIWVYDDASVDNTGSVAEKLGAMVIRGTRNVGCTAGKNTLLGITKSTWVHFHDADDELMPDFVVRAKQLISEREADVFVVGNEELSEGDPDYTVVSRPDVHLLAADPFSYSMLYKVNAISGVYRRDFLLTSEALTIDPLMQYNEDQAIQLNLVKAGARFWGSSEVLVRSYKRDASMSQANGLRCLRSHLEVLKNALGHADAIGARGRVATPIAERLWAVAAGAAAAGDLPSAYEALELSRSLGPVPNSAGGTLFRVLATLSPKKAVATREFLIRRVKPRLRENKVRWAGDLSMSLQDGQPSSKQC